MPINSLTACVLVLNDEYWLPFALESSRGHFERYVIYDVGSTDRTKDVIHWFMESNKEADYFLREFDSIPPRQVQGVFRNSMIAEARTEWYYILDGDEVYNDLGKLTIPYSIQHKDHCPIYGVVRRCELSPDLRSRYSVYRTHHRAYRRTAIFTGSHPGEIPLIEQKPSNEYQIEDVLCYHFHNTLRSSKESEALKRDERKNQKTYHPGELLPFNLLDAVPILRKPIADFPVAPALRKLQDEYIV